MRMNPFGVVVFQENDCGSGSGYATLQQLAQPHPLRHRVQPPSNTNAGQIERKTAIGNVCAENIQIEMHAWSLHNGLFEDYGQNDGSHHERYGSFGHLLPRGMRPFDRSGGCKNRQTPCLRRVI